MNKKIKLENETVLFETLYWLVRNTKVDLNKKDSKETILKKLAMILIFPIDSDKTLERVKKSLSRKEASGKWKIYN